MSLTSTRFGFPSGTTRPFRAALALLCTHWLLFGLVYQWLQPELPLFYSLAQRSQQLASKEWLVLLPGMASFWFFLAIVLARIGRGSDVGLLRLFSWSISGLQALWLLVFVRILVITW